jgi:AraC-like DNA-binding protein
MTNHTTLHAQRLDLIETAPGPLYALPSHYPAGHSIDPHHHSRAQLLYPRTGVVMVTSSQGRWMVPPEHALWIPPELEHSVEMIGHVHMLSIYVSPNALPNMSANVRVVALTDLARALIVEAVALPQEATTRSGLVMALLLDEIAKLPEVPLGLPFPSEPRLAALCRSFIENPSPHLVIDDWAEALAMSRRAFTRAFRHQTGVSLSLWRQQACLLNALPRLANGEAVTSVALDLGYDSVAAFTTMFKRMLGAPPRQYFQGGGGGG